MCCGSLSSQGERSSRFYAIYLVGVAEWLALAFHLFIGAPTQEMPLLRLNLLLMGTLFDILFSCSVVVRYSKGTCEYHPFGMFSSLKLVTGNERF